MAIIEVKKLSKKFRVKLKEKGLKGSIKSIVKPKYKEVKAVKDISFEIEKGEMDVKRCIIRNVCFTHITTSPITLVGTIIILKKL